MYNKYIERMDNEAKNYFFKVQDSIADGRYNREIEEMGLKGLDILNKIYPEKNIVKCFAYNIMGNLYEIKGDKTGALQMFEKCFEHLMFFNSNDKKIRDLAVDSIIKTILIYDDQNEKDKTCQTIIKGASFIHDESTRGVYRDISSVDLLFVIGLTFSRYGLLDIASGYLKECHDILEELPQKDYGKLAHVDFKLAQLCEDAGHRDLAKKYILNSYYILLEHGSSETSHLDEVIGFMKKIDI